jgi:hypothetical protein
VGAWRGCQCWIGWEGRKRYGEVARVGKGGRSGGGMERLPRLERVGG